MLTNPMMLYLAIKVAMERKRRMVRYPVGTSFQNRSELYEIFVSGLFTHYESKKEKLIHANRVQIENALTELYFKLQCRNQISCK